MRLAEARPIMIVTEVVNVEGSLAADPEGERDALPLAPGDQGEMVQQRRALLPQRRGGQAGRRGVADDPDAVIRRQERGYRAGGLVGALEGASGHRRLGHPEVTQVA